MNVFQWDSSLNTGFAEVDRQHQHLVKLTSDFGSLLSENQLHGQDLETLYGELVNYTQYHFEEEEALVKQHNVDPRMPITIVRNTGILSKKSPLCANR